VAEPAALNEKKLTSSEYNRFLECLITLQRSVINKLKSRGRTTDPCGTPQRNSKGNEKVSKMCTKDCRLIKGTYDASLRYRQKAGAQNVCEVENGVRQGQRHW